MSVYKFKTTVIDGNLTCNGNLSINTDSIALGTNAGITNPGLYSVAIGYSAGQDTFGAYNVGIGYLSGQYQKGSQNVSIGYDAGTNGAINYTGSNNVSIGSNSGLNSSNTSYGIAIGANSITDMSNIAIGSGANALGTNNTVIGAGATTGNWGNSMAIGTGSQITSSIHLGDFQLQNTNVDNPWKSVCFGTDISGVTGGKRGLFAAVSYDGSFNRVMTSEDAINWNVQPTLNTSYWTSIASGNTTITGTYVSGTPILVAVGTSSVMISQYGNSWSTANMNGIDSNNWVSVTYGKPTSGTYTAGVFIAASNSGTANRLMLSQNGNTWITSGFTGVLDISYSSITFGGGTFVAVADVSFNSSYSGNLIITSTTGTAWTSYKAPVQNNWSSVIYGTASTGLYQGIGVFVAVAYGGTSNRVMTSIDLGITWIAQKCPVYDWYSVSYGNGYFVAVSYSGVSMSSTDAINWTLFPTPAKNMWSGIAYGVPAVGSYTGQGVFAAVSTTGSNRVMTSSFADSATISSLSIGNKAFSNGESVLTVGEGARVSGSLLGQFALQSTATEDSTWKSVISGIVTATGQTIFVAISDGGTNRVYTSSDGITWTSRTASNSNAWQSITYGVPTTGTFANIGLFVAVASSVVLSGTSVMTSTDGINWTSRSTTGFDNGWQSITFGKVSTGIYSDFNAFVAVSRTGSNRVMVSYDGITWNNTNPNVNNNQTWSSITYGAPSVGIYQGLGTFVAIANSGTGTGTRIMYSTDLSGWTTFISLVPDLSWNSITYGTPSTGTYKGQGVFVAVSRSGRGNRVLTTTDLSTCSINTTLDPSWNRVSYDKTYDNSWNSVGYGNGYFVAVSSSGTGNRIMTSTDTVNWTSQRSPADISWNGITYGVPSIGTYTGQGIFVGVADNGTSRVMTANFPNVYKNNSAAIGNSALTTGNNSMAVGIGSASLGDNSVAYGVGASVTGNNSVAIGTSAKVISPFHLGDWKGYTATGWNGERVWNGLTYGNGLFVLTLMDGISPNKILTSPDGINWTYRQAVGDISWNSVVYGIPSTGTYAGQGLFVGVPYSGTSTQRVITSPDGINWTVRNTNIDISLCSVITYGNGVYVASKNGTTIIYSTDGVTWGSAAVSNNRYSVCYGNGIFVAISSGTGSTANRLYRSTNGISWTAYSVIADSVWWDIAYGNGLFVAIANSGSILASSLGYAGTGLNIMTSPDGIIWTPRSTPLAGNEFFLRIAFGNGLFVITTYVPGNYSLISSDGINWTVKSIPGNNLWRCLTYGTVNGIGTFVAAYSLDNDYANLTPQINIMVASFEETQNSIAIGQSAIVNGSGSVAIGANAKVSGSVLSNFVPRTTPLDNISGGFGGCIQTGVPSSGPYQNQTLYLATTSVSGSRFVISVDVINWIPTSMPIGNDRSIANMIWGIPSTGIYAGKGLFVGVTTEAVSLGIFTSTDGITWTVRTNPDNITLQDITFGNGTFLAVSSGVFTGTSTNRVLRSTDGINWTGITSAATNFTTNAWVSITYGSGYFVCVAGSGSTLSMVSADNGITWATNSLSGVTAGSGGGAFNIQYGIPSTGKYAGQGLFVVTALSQTGGSLVINYGTNGSSWSSTTITTMTPGWSSASYGNGTFVVIVYVLGSINYILTSTDGYTWTTIYTTFTNLDYIKYGIPTVGPYAGQGMFAIALNVAIGTKILTANFVDTNISNSVAIGNGAVATENNQIVLGTTNETVEVPGYLKINSSIAGIRGIYGGYVNDGLISGTVNFGFFFPSVPIVIATINSGSTTQIFTICISNITTKSFDYSKTFRWTDGRSGGGAGEAFYWVAICL